MAPSVPQPPEKKRTLRASTESKSRISKQVQEKNKFEDGLLKTRRLVKTGDGLISMKMRKYNRHITVANSLSPLLALPPEIRNKIFAYVVDTGPITITKPNGDISEPSAAILTILQDSKKPAVRNALALPRVCRQIYAETTTLIYSLNRFEVPYCLFERFAVGPNSVLLPAQKAAMQNLYVGDGTTPGFVIKMQWSLAGGRWYVDCKDLQERTGSLELTGDIRKYLY